MILSATNISKVYGTGKVSVRALDNVSLSIHQSDITAIIGVSGSGKSTLLHLLSTLDSPTSGQVFFKGTDIFQLNAPKRAQLRRRHFGFVFL